MPVAEATTAETKEIRGANENVEADGRADKCLQCHSVASVRHGGYSDRLLEYQYSAAVSFSFQLLAHARSSKEDTHVIKGPNR